MRDETNKIEHRLRSQTFWIAREHGSLSDVIQTEIKHDNTLHSNAASSVRWATETEGFDVGSDLCDI